AIHKAMQTTRAIQRFFRCSLYLTKVRTTKNTAMHIKNAARMERKSTISISDPPNDDFLSSYIFPPYSACLIFFRTTRRAEVAFFCCVIATAFVGFVSGL